MPLNDIKLRLALPKDENDLLVWRNDPITVSFTPKKNTISPNDHRKWFKTQLESNESWIFIACESNSKIGMVRFDFVDYYLNNYYEISINLNPEFRGRKLSSFIINEGIRHLKSEHEVSFPIFAKIHDENIPSIKSFKKAQFDKYKRKINDSYIKDPVSEGWNYYIFKK